MKEMKGESKQEEKIGRREEMQHDQNHKFLFAIRIIRYIKRNRA